jgi:putative ABC transport system permease protein
MFGTRSRKIFADVVARKGRTLLVSAAIFIGVAGTVALFTMSDVLNRQLEQDVQEDRLAMARVTVNADSGAALDNAGYLQTLAAMPGVTRVVGAVEGQTVYFKLAETDEDFKEGKVKASAVVDEAGELVSVFGDEAPIEPLRLEMGAFPAAGANEIAVETRMADRYGLAVSDTLELRVLSPSRLPERSGATGTVETWRISGIVFDAYSGGNPAKALFARIEDATYLVGLAGFTEFGFRFTDYPTAERQIDSIVNYIATDMPYTPVETVTEDPANSSLLEGARITGSLMSTLAMTALVVSGFLVINVISSIVVEQKRQIGVMKALGATRLDNITIYTGIALLYGVLGVIPGVLVGIPVGNAAAHGLGPEMNVLLKGFQLSPRSIGLGIVMGLLVPVLASLPPVLNGTRVRILDAITDLGIDARYGGGLLARLIRRLPVPTTVRQGLSNIMLKKARMAFTILTLAVAVGAFMGIYAGFEQLKNALSLLEDHFQVEIALVPLETRDSAEITDLLASSFSDTIQSVEPGIQTGIEVEGYEPKAMPGPVQGIIAYGYDVTSDHPALVYTLEKGEKLTADTAATGLVISDRLADGMGKTVGDHVTIKVPGSTADLVIVGVAKFPFDQVWMAWETLARLAGYGQRPPMYFLATRLDNPTAGEVDDLINRMTETFAEAGIPVTASNLVQMVDNITETYTSFQMIFQMVALLIALVGALGLLITLSLSVFERQKEIGVMRSLGAQSFTIASQFITEGLVVGVLAWVAGLPLMLVLEALLIEIIGSTSLLKIEITPLAVIIGLAGITTITFVASLLPALSAARKTVSDILRYA